LYSADFGGIDEALRESKLIGPETPKDCCETF
jgi:hypothetical protein